MKRLKLLTCLMLVVLMLGLTVFVVPTQATQLWFGYNTVGQTFDTATFSGLLLQQITTPATGGDNVTLQNFNFYGEGGAPSGTNVVPVVYADWAGWNEPDLTQLLYNGSPQLISTSENWHTVSVSSSWTLLPATTYWFGFSRDNSLVYYYDSNSGNLLDKSGTTLFDKQWSFYVNYIVGSPAPTPTPSPSPTPTPYPTPSPIPSTQLYEYTTVNNTGLDAAGSGAPDVVAQTFTPSVTHTITNLAFSLYNVSGYGNLAGTLDVQVIGTDGSGVPLYPDPPHIYGEGSMDCSQINNHQFYTMTMTTPATVLAGTTYALLMNFTLSSGSVGFDGYTSSNPLNISQSFLQYGGTWYFPSNPPIVDFGFQIWGNIPALPSPSPSHGAGGGNNWMEASASPSPEPTVTTPHEIAPLISREQLMFGMVVVIGLASLGYFLFRKKK